MSTKIYGFIINIASSILMSDVDYDKSCEYEEVG